MAVLGGEHVKALIDVGEWIEIDYEQHQKNISK
jgi:hypothetical protein